MQSINLSYWDQTYLKEPVDLIIIGAGITGLSTALHVNQLRPHWRIRILDKYSTTRAASTRNAGFACFGSPSEIQSDMIQSGKETALNLVRRRKEGIDRLLTLFSPHQLDYAPCGGFEILDKEQYSSHQVVDLVRNLNDELLAFFPSPVFLFHERKREALPFDASHHIVSNPFEGQLNPAKLVRALQSRLKGDSIELIYGIEVVGIDQEGDRQIVQTVVGGELSAERVLIATNGLTQHFELPDVHIQPARNMILMSEEIPSMFQGTFHAEEGFIYFRNVGKRLLIGGGRHWDKENEMTTIFGYNAYILQRLKTYVEQVIFPGRQDIVFPTQWSGIMGMTKNKTPIIKKLKNELYIAAGHSGMGVALGMQSGAQAAQLLTLS